MKKLLILTILIAPLFLKGQGVLDIYNISTSNYQGTAKSMAMGNAMGAVGQDFSSIAINPAGVALFRKPTFTITPSLYNTYTKTEINGSDSWDSKSKISFNNIGYVSTLSARNHSSYSDVWAFGMNRVNNFNNRVYTSFYNGYNSLVDPFINELIDYHITDADELSQFSPGYIYPLWQTYLLDFTPDGITSPIPVGGLTQIREVNTWGGTNEWNLTYGANINDKIYFGLSLNMPYLYSKRASSYGEINENDTPDNDFREWYQDESVSTTGWGFNVKAGVIVYPLRWLRVGFAFHSPSIYNISESWRTETTSYFDNGQYYEQYNYNTPTNTYSYIMKTPERYNFSAAFIFGNFGMITADYELVNYKNMHVMNSNDYDYSYLNNAIDNNMALTGNFRLGTEWRFQNWCVRGGYSYNGSPYGLSSNILSYNSYSLGFGYTYRLFTIDVAYVIAGKYNEYYLYSPFTSYTIIDEQGNLIPNNVKESTLVNNFIVTMRFRLF
ncbi:MAG TPA: hypothetical protein IAD13_01115 [Bacteroidetes bacterium]|nr:hypothetical protein [Candidatus Limimorpha avicola]